MRAKSFFIVPSHAHQLLLQDDGAQPQEAVLRLPLRAARRDESIEASPRRRAEM
jgi:hypothetical protein